MERYIFKHLRDWSAAPKRKVLLLRGARQVGKTYAARVLGQDFENFLEVNFEEENLLLTSQGNPMLAGADLSNRRPLRAGSADGRVLIHERAPVDNR